MENRGVEIIVYGAEELCPSCLHSPSSKETFDWLNAAISRKYPEQPFEITYVDINNPPNVDSKQEFAKKVIEEGMFYPVVVINGKIVGEGNPRLKTIYTELEKHGYQQS
ncbi:YuzD family protein [Neobacillus sp. PS3-40]|uniref:YuzD family protein n=1 Tax=Neobacillus sp. PS3-40 TaxID=3070679 RepID=UPI0027DF055B|nr:YuzD family protein [Neobacillus sp. PS3-40]WML45888.1 YuzD family protein [Neobacillus sp. PS3-40]